MKTRKTSTWGCRLPEPTAEYIARHTPPPSMVKAWFEGFCAGVDTRPTKAQWELLKEYLNNNLK